MPIVAQHVIRWWVSNIFLFSPPKLGKIFNLTHIFSNGLVQPPTRCHFTLASGGSCSHGQCGATNAVRDARCGPDGVRWPWGNWWVVNILGGMGWF